MNRSQLEQKILEAEAIREAILAELALRSLELQYDGLYGWQNDFIAATHDHFESCLMAANQIGKSFIGRLMDAIHLTGDYPDDWKGHRFEFAPLCWGLGYSMEKTRDLLQNQLFGDYIGGEFTGGLVAKDSIVSWESATGTPNAMRSVFVKHKSGGLAQMQFWSYSQGQHAIMGDVVDWFHVDEEPKDPKIRPQLLTRTVNGDKGRGGRGIYTFTPENGRTELVLKFMDDPSDDQFFMKKGWRDAPHITPEKAARLMKQYPAHQRKMRTEGEPLMGEGLIYDMDLDLVLCDPFEIPTHWKLINGMDFGWDHPSAFVQLWLDPDTDTIYVTRAWKQRECSANNAWGAVGKWVKDIPVAWPLDGLQNEKAREDAVQQKKHYQEAGFKMLPSHATWPNYTDADGKDRSGGNSVEQGLHEIRGRAQNGLFKIFNTCQPLIDEWANYHRVTRGDPQLGEKSVIVKKNDDLLDAMRYAYMMRRYATSNTTQAKQFRMPQRRKVIGSART